MSAIVEFMEQGLWTSRLAPTLLDAGLKSIVLVCFAGIFCLCRQRLPAAARHSVWFAAVLGALVCPLISLFVPSWHQPLWVVAGRLDAGNELAVVVSIAPERRAVAPPKLEPHPRAGNPTSAAGSVESIPSWFSAEFGSNWVSAASVIWAVGAVLIWTRMVVAWLGLAALRRNVRPMLLEPRLNFLESELCLRLEIRRPVLLLHSSQNVMPLTWGIRRPVILLPAQAGEWSGAKLRVVLLHELAHVKRWDCLSQFVCQIACGLYWFNPLIWLAAWRMRVEREFACDDLVLDDGCKASEYAGHLLEIARTSRNLRPLSGIAMARSSHLGKRIRSIVRPARSPQLAPRMTLALWLLLAGAVIAVAANRVSPQMNARADRQALEQQLLQLRSFSNAKLQQSQDLARRSGGQISPLFQQFFDAAVSGDFQTVTNMYADFKRRHPQYSRSTEESDPSLSTSYWSPVLEICLAYDHVVRCTPKYTAKLANGIIQAIPKGSIYFGGTDPGRGIPTAFAKSQPQGDPFFILTQNAFADRTYLKYLREMYAAKIYTPSDEDSQRCFGDYCAEALRRLEHDREFPLEPKQVHPGEKVSLENGKGAVSGQVAVMGINGLLARLIFDRNPQREFFIEESFPLDWMYPYLEPHGLIMKINRVPQARLSAKVVARDHAYWQKLVAEMLGDWLHEETPVDTVTDFVDRVYIQKNLSGFTGDPSYIGNDYARRLFSKLRCSIGGLYAWRAAHPTDSGETGRMESEADLAFRQAFGTVSP